MPSKSMNEVIIHLFRRFNPWLAAFEAEPVDMEAEEQAASGLIRVAKQHREEKKNEGLSERPD